jgi:ATP-dependent RNA helicase RhlE
MNFDTLGLSEELLRAVRDTGYTKPTPIQAQAIPAILKGSDIMAAAQTGTGKTAGFTLPLLQRLSNKPKVKSNRVRALVLAPTRELAAQVQESVFTYGKHMNLRSAVVFGGVGINPQMMKLRKGVDVLVATPGRLLDLYNQNAVRFNDLEILVLDEADRMLDMGFIHDIKKIMALLPKKRQNLMFSATFSNEIRQLAKGIINNPVEIDVAPRNSTVEKISQLVHPVDKARKIDLLSHLIKKGDWYQVLVFARTKHGSDKLVRKLRHHNINAAAIHGNKSQSQRTKALADFKQNKVQVLVATDIASRGIDIDQLSHVVNFDLPNVSEDYVHRIGRTGRAGKSGQAISLVSADEIKQLQDIEKLISFKIKREEIEGFEPEHVVPESIKTKSGNNKNRSRNNNSNKNNTSKKKRSWKGAKKKTRSKDGNSNSNTGYRPPNKKRRTKKKTKSAA